MLKTIAVLLLTLSTLLLVNTANSTVSGENYRTPAVAKDMSRLPAIIGTIETL